VTGDIQELMGDSTEKMTIQTEKINEILNSIFDLENNVRLAKKELLDANMIMKDELLQVTSNLINKGNYNLEKQVGPQNCASRLMDSQSNGHTNRKCG
jgi:H2-forming N5,N10-methylenetetrahydromethanopterin dehydrogenase-like enzyme